MQGIIRISNLPLIYELATIVVNMVQTTTNSQ